MHVVSKPPLELKEPDGPLTVLVTEAAGPG